MKKLSGMVYKKFYFRILIQLIFLCVTMMALSWSFVHPNLLVTRINLGVIILLQIIYLFHFLNRTTRDLDRFFEAIRFQDTSVTFQSGQDKSFKELYRHFNLVIDQVRQLRSSLEKDRFFYLNALNHIAVGLLVMDEAGNILFSNKSFDEFFASKKISHIEALKSLKTDLPDLVMTIRVNHKKLAKVVLNNEVVLLSMRCSEFKVEDRLLKIISFQDILFEVEQKELEAWQKLIRILMHEIMNSVSPITLTSAGIIQLLEKDGKPVSSKEIEDDHIERILLGSQAIRKRSKGLANYVEGYRSITHLPPPVLTKISVGEMFVHLETLLKDEFLHHGIALKTEVYPGSLVLHADEKLVEQLLLNLIKNSIAALSQSETKLITLRAFSQNNHSIITVTDTGKGIPAELLDTIFVPFFTTRENGSGIGLSLSREIMKMHGGSIKVSSHPGVETTFTLVF